MAFEPLPDHAYCPPINSYFLSVGKTQLYQCLSYPLCRIYWDAQKDNKPTAWTTESAWYDTGDPKKGWRRSGPNYPSFLVCCIDTEGAMIGKPRYITLRNKPIWSESLDQLITIINQSRKLCLTESMQTPPLLNLKQQVIDRMISCG